MDDDLPSPRSFFLIAVAFEGSLGLVALVLGYLLGLPGGETVRWTLPAVGCGAAAAGPPLVLAWICTKWPLAPFRKILRVVDEMLVPLFRPCRLWELAVISAVAGLGEEMLFRGVLQEALAGWVGGASGVWVGLIGASVLFGLVHCITPTYALLAGLIGLYLGWLWIATGNMLVPITTHAVYDFLALVYLIRIRGRGLLIADC